MFLITFINVSAQSIYFNFSDGRQAVYSISDVRNITFSGDEMRLNRVDGTTIAWNVSVVGNYRFDQILADIDEVKKSPEIRLFPSPSQGMLNISYELDLADKVNVIVYNSQGAIVYHTSPEFQSVGVHELIWQHHNLPSGTYILCVRSTRFTLNKTILLQ